MRVALGVVVLVVAQQLFAVPGDSRVAEAFHDALHVPWFAAVTLALCWLLSLRLALVVAFALLLGSEAVQYFTGRDAELLDLLRNGLGLAVGVCIYAAIRAHKGWALAALVGLALAAVPVVQAQIDRLRADAQFPVLFEAPNSVLARYLEPNAPAEWQEDGLLVRLDEGDWPGVHVTEVNRTFDGYERLVVTLAVPEGTVALFIGVRVQPGSEWAGYVEQTFESGLHIWQVPTEKLLQPGQVAEEVFVYADRRARGRAFVLQRVLLARECGSSDPDRSCPDLQSLRG